MESSPTMDGLASHCRERLNSKKNKNMWRNGRKMSVAVIGGSQWVVFFFELQVLYCAINLQYPFPSCFSLKIMLDFKLSKQLPHTKWIFPLSGFSTLSEPSVLKQNSSKLLFQSLICISIKQKPLKQYKSNSLGIYYTRGCQNSNDSHKKKQ